jgi:glycosyltransferase involved in cell wall biosynthesis
LSSISIALVHNLAPGGAKRAMQEHQRRLGGTIQEFCLATSKPVTDDATTIPFRPRAPGLRPVLRPLPRHLDLVSLIRAWCEVARAVNASGAQVVLAHPCQFLQAPLALRWLNAPSVYFCHEPRRRDYEQAASILVNPRTRHLYSGLSRVERGLDRAAVRSADRLLTNSRFTSRRIREAYGLLADPVPLGVADAFREPYPELEPTHLLSVGTLIPSKGHDLVIAAAARATRRWPVVVVSPRQESEESLRLQTIASAQAVTLEIRVGVSDAELAELYRSALATLYLAREEPLGLVSLEAQACGSPVIVADEGGLPETMIPGETGWALNRNDTASAAAAIDALEDQNLRRAYCRRAREHGASQTWERSTEYMRAVLEQACRT